MLFDEQHLLILGQGPQVIRHVTLDRIRKFANLIHHWAQRFGAILHVFLDRSKLMLGGRAVQLADSIHHSLSQRSNRLRTFLLKRNPRFASGC